MTKKIQERKEYFIQFTDEECEQLNIKEGQKFSMKEMGDGSIKMTPYASIDIDLEEFSRESMIFIISQSVEKDISVNQVMEEVLKGAIEKYGEQN
jgi:hypothetical protein